MGSMSMCPVEDLEPMDRIVLGNLVIEVMNTPADDAAEGKILVRGLTVDSRPGNASKIAVAVSPDRMVPKFEDDPREEMLIVDGYAKATTSWPCEPVIFVDEGVEKRFYGSLGEFDWAPVRGIYVRRDDGDGQYAYVGLNGDSELIRSSDRIIKYRPARQNDFVAEGINDNEQ